MSTAVSASLIPIRWADNDPLGHVTNGVLLSYLDEARDAFLGATLPDFSRTDYVVARVEVDFLLPVALEHGAVRGHICVGHVGEKAIALDERLTVGEADGEPEVAVSARTTIVRWDKAAGRSVALSATERKRLIAGAGRRQT